MMKELKKKLGTGLTVTCEKPAGGFNAVSLEWEESEGLSEDQEDRATF